jgi:bifunctional non-homologous end joining protein LigD
MAARRGPRWRDDPQALRPMLAQAEAVVFDPATAELDPRFVYEPKYDGMRALVELAPVEAQRRTAARPRVRIWSRLGHEKTLQFPDLIPPFEAVARAVGRPVVLDGEIVAVGPDGRPLGFQKLQGRLHLTAPRQIAAAAAQQPVAFVAFDLLRDGDEDVRPLPLSDRRARLARLLRAAPSGAVRLGEQARAPARDLLRRLGEGGGEGLVAKDPMSPYESGRRSAAWRKLKIVHRQEFVVGGWTEPRGARRHFGALLLGLWHDGRGRPERAGSPPPPSGAGEHAAARRARPAGRLVYVGHVGSGFSDAALAQLGATLRALETRDCPFAEPPRTNARAHWVRPVLVAEVQFQDWTEDGRLRAPVFLGLRGDVRPEEVGREGEGRLDPLVSADAASAQVSLSPEIAALVDRVRDLEERRRDGVVTLPDGATIRLTNLAKPFWPALGLTKGDLVRYYLRVAPYLLPVVADRPLVMQRFPDGIDGEAFYQQRAPQRPPRGVRVEVVAAQGERLPRLVGGSLATLLYMVQLATISQDPWFSRVDTPGEADFAALDLDPMPGVPFQQVRDVARWIRDELERLGVPAAAKTSGARGVHIFVPLPPGTSYESGLLFCQIVATLVATKHPEAASVERVVAARGRTVYVDYLQNVQGKTLAAAYSARASPFAGVSTPLAWEELDEAIDPRDFTLRNIEARLAARGDLWARLDTGPRADLGAALDRMR